MIIKYRDKETGEERWTTRGVRKEKKRRRRWIVKKRRVRSR